MPDFLKFQRNKLVEKTEEKDRIFLLYYGDKIITHIMQILLKLQKPSQQNTSAKPDNEKAA